jgi:hypothetical protein
MLALCCRWPPSETAQTEGTPALCTWSSSRKAQWRAFWNLLWTSFWRGNADKKSKQQTNISQTLLVVNYRFIFVLSVGGLSFLYNSCLYNIITCLLCLYLVRYIMRSVMTHPRR